MRKMLVLAATLCFAALAMAPTAVERSFLKFGDIKGESTDVQHREWFETTSFSWGAHQTGFTGPACLAGPGGGPQTLHFTRTGHPSELGNLFRQHRLIPSATVEVNGERHLLEGVTLTSFDTKPAGNGNVTESVSLNFTKCETHSAAQSPIGTDKQQKIDTRFLKVRDANANFLKVGEANAILIGLTPKPEASALIGLLFNGDGHSARLTRQAGGAQDAFHKAFRTRQVIPTLTLTLNNGQKWTFTNVTIAGITDGTSNTEQLSLNFSKFDGPPAGFQNAH